MESSGHLPFTYQQGRERGLTRSRLLSDDFVQLLHGVYVPTDTKVDGYVAARAALLVAQPGAFLSHHSAAWLWGGVVPRQPMAHVSIPAGRGRSTRRDMVVHSSRRQATRFRGQPLTTAVDTFLDLAAYLNLVDLVILGDSLVRRGRCTPESLVEAAAQGSGRGVRLARRAASLVRSRVDSPMETKARMLRVLSGLPELETDLRFYDSQGQLVRRLDAGDRATRTAVEYDGRQHVNREDQWESDLLRREEFEDQEWRIVTLVSKDIYTWPGRTVDRLARIFQRRGIKVGPRSDEWRRHFHGRDC